MAIDHRELSKMLRVHPGIREVVWSSTSREWEQDRIFFTDNLNLNPMDGTIEIKVGFQYTFGSKEVNEVTKAVVPMGLNSGLSKVILALETLDTQNSDEWMDIFHLDGVAWGFRGASAVMPVPVTRERGWRILHPFLFHQVTEEYGGDGLISIDATLVAFITQN